MPRKQTRYRKRKVRNTRKTRGGMAPVSAPTMILTPEEMAATYFYVPYDDMRYNHMFADSRTPLLNTAHKLYSYSSSDV